MRFVFIVVVIALLACVAAARLHLTPEQEAERNSLMAKANKESKDAYNAKRAGMSAKEKQSQHIKNIGKHSGAGGGKNPSGPGVKHGLKTKPLKGKGKKSEKSVKGRSGIKQKGKGKAKGAKGKKF